MFVLITIHTLLKNDFLYKNSGMNSSVYFAYLDCQFEQAHIQYFLSNLLKFSRKTQSFCEASNKLHCELTTSFVSFLKIIPQRELSPLRVKQIFFTEPD